MMTARLRPLRTRRGQLQTPVRQYRHPQTGRRVVLIGMQHIGARSYYERIQGLLSELEVAGLAVHYERVRPAPADEWVQATDEERSARETITRT